jgi:Zn finger protein HypA/HybF involved in hydrogenase expression
MEGTGMRERAAIGALIDAVLADIRAAQPCRVDLVRVQRSSSFSHDTLLRGFKALTAGTSLEGARLAVDVVNRFVMCACGRAPIVTTDDLLGRIWVCAVCGHAEEIDPLDDLALLEVSLQPLETAEPARAASA